MKMAILMLTDQPANLATCQRFQNSIFLCEFDLLKVHCEIVGHLFGPPFFFLVSPLANREILCGFCLQKLNRRDLLPSVNNP